MRILFLIFLIFNLSSCSLVQKLLKQKSEPINSKIIKIDVFKKERELHLLDENYDRVKSYKIALGWSPVGAKQFEGDGKTPEGEYFIAHKNDKSQYHLSLLLSYPNKEQHEFANKFGKSAGGAIMIHGLANGSGWNAYFQHLFKDWTAGCIAVNDDEIEEIWDLVEVGTKVEVFP